MSDNKINSTQVWKLLSEITEKREIDFATLAAILEDAFTKAYLKNSPGSNFEVRIDLKKEEISFYEVFVVVEDQKAEIEDYELGFDDVTEILLSEARTFNPRLNVGDKYYKEYDIKNFKQVQVQMVIGLLRQKINEIINKRIAEEWLPKKGEIIKGIIRDLDVRSVSGSKPIVQGAKVALDDQEKSFGYFSMRERLNNEELIEGQSYDFIIKDVKEQSRLWPVTLTRREPKLVEHILKNEILDIRDGSIKIEKIVRSPKIRKTKIAVSTTLNVDPVSLIVGHHGLKIKSLSEDILFGEKIDVIKYSDDDLIFIAEAIGFKKVIGYLINEEYDWRNNPREKFKGKITIFVNEEDLSMIIGKNGENIRLISELTNWKVDVKTTKEASLEKIFYEKFSLEAIRQKNIEKIKNNSYSNDEYLALINESQTTNEENVTNNETKLESIKKEIIVENKDDQIRNEPLTSSSNKETNKETESSEDIEFFEDFEDLDLGNEEDK